MATSLGRHPPGIDLGPYPAGDLPDFGLTVFEVPYSRHLAVDLAIGSCVRGLTSGSICAAIRAGCEPGLRENAS